nr:hypothetical protein [Tanacetum cinerariifolium]
MSYLSDFESINGGYVAFGRNPKGGKITIKLPDESHVLLRVPRENNMYNIDLKNIVPSGDLTCLFAKATLDESNLWHRRLGHINLKIMNKLVKGIKKEFSVARTPQQNGIAERKNRTLIENRVLVTKPHNKAPYELLHSRTPSIGFMRPSGYPVTIFNTLDLLGKFDEKVDEGFLVGYSISSAQDHFDAEKARDENVQQYVLFPLWSFGSKDPRNTDDDTIFEVKENEFEVEKPESEVHVSLSSKFEDFSDNSTNEVNAASTPVLAVGQKSTNSTNTFSAVGPSNTIVSPTLRESSYVDPSQYPDDPDMPALEDITYSDVEEDVGTEADFTNLETTITVSPILTTRVHRDHHVSQIISDLSFGPLTRSMTRMVSDEGGLTQINTKDFHTCMFACFLSQEEPKRVHQALKDHSWIEAMQEELLQFKMQIFWVLVDLPKGKRSIVLRIEAIRLFLAYASFMGFMVYQMDVKSAFLYETIKEEVYVCQPLGFKDPDYPDKVYKVLKALYGLHQAPRAWYETLANYLLENDLCKAFKKLMKDKFQMSLMGELTFFLGLQVKQKPDGIFISQNKYVAKILRKFGVTDGKSASTPIDTKKPLLKNSDVKRIFRYLKGKPHLGLWYPKDSPFNLVAYSDSDYVGASLDRKSTTGGCQFLGCRLISWQCKKQTVVTTSFIEAEYVATASCCAKVLWIQNQLLNYRKKVVITKDTVREALHLDDADSIDCLPNEEIFIELARMGVGKGFYRVETPLFEGMTVAHQVDDVADEGVAGVNVDDVPAANAEPTIPSPTPTTQSPPPSQEQEQPSTLQEVIANMDTDKDVTLKDAVAVAKEVEVEKDAEVKKDANVHGRPVESQAQIYKIDLEHADKVLSMQDVKLETAELKEVIRKPSCLASTTPLINKKDEEHNHVDGTTRICRILSINPQTNMDTDKDVTLKDVATVAKEVKVEKDAEIKKDADQAQIEQDKAYARELEVELNKNINWDEVIENVKEKGRQDNDVLRYQALKRKPQTKAQARKNMMIYLKNMDGFKLEYFKGMSYDVIRLIFKKYFNSNVAFLKKTKEELEEEESRALKRKVESLEEKAAKKQKLDEEVSVVDYEIYSENNKPYYKIKRADISHQLFLSFLSLLRNFNREDLEMILLEERRYPWKRFTLDQMFNNVRLEVKEESEVSLELLRFVRQQ